MEELDVLKALADSNRLRILNVLRDQPLCVCDLEEVLGLQQSNLSRHLDKLKQAGLVKGVKRGLFTYFTRTLPRHWGQTVKALFDELEQNPDAVVDRERLKLYLEQAQDRCGFPRSSE
jgi:ArsR family transcriptional regulator